MSDNQVALSRITRAGAGSLSKATRQAVPPFLQKLYEMVSDSATDYLIRWSENGDSFFVLDHERVAHDVLPRWFKHSNFASFVRQLNMYGFHKIPHLQQGVLKSESETEIWNFEHPNFRRGQPDLLCLITRKKQAQERQGEDGSIGQDKDGVSPGLVAGGFTPGSLVDINSIINGISAIKRHQATISADLNDLKASNQHLWQEALDARERHQKQQDTINRILKFLAGVFGNATGHKGSPGRGSPHAGIPRKRQRLMIEGSAQSLKDKPLEPLDGDEPMSETEADEATPTNRFVEVSPSPKTSSVVTDTPDAQTPVPQYPSHHGITADVLMGGNFPNQPPPFFSFPSTLPKADPPVYARANDAHTPTALTPSPTGPSQELLQSIVNSPGSLQRLLNLLSSQQQQQNIPMPPHLDLNDTNADELNGYSNDSFDHYSQSQYPPSSASDPTFTVPSNFDIMEPDSQTMSLLQTDDMPGISFDPYIENANRLKKTSDASSVITDHVNMMDSNIESLIKHLGLDPQQLDGMRDDATFDGEGEGENNALFSHDKADPNSNPNPSHASVLSSDPLTSLNPTNTADGTTDSNTVSFQPSLPDFDFTAFINELTRQNGAETNNLSGNSYDGEYKPDGMSCGIDPLMEKTAAVSVGAPGVGARAGSDPTTPPHLSAFVDEIASQSGQSDSSSPPRTRAGIPDDPTASPTAVTATLASDLLKKTTAGRKRKSDVDPPVSAEPTFITDHGQTKAKRKRQSLQ